MEYKLTNINELYESIDFENKEEEIQSIFTKIESELLSSNTDFGKVTMKYSYHFEPDIVEFIKLNFSYSVEQNIVSVTYDGIA